MRHFIRGLTLLLLALGTANFAGASVTTTVVSSPTSTTPVVRALTLGNTGASVLALQRRLVALGYWLGTPDGRFGDSTQQAVFALQKVAGIGRDGVVGPLTAAALSRGVVPRVRTVTGSAIEINLSTQVLMIVKNSQLVATLNTSTGGGYTYVDQGHSYVAQTPRGTFHVFRQVNAMDVSSLGQLWRPKYFSGGYAIHGSLSVPPYPASHGCVRVSDEAIDWIWAANKAPLGVTVWIF